MRRLQRLAGQKALDLHSYSGLRSHPESADLSLREAMHAVVFANRFYGYRRITAKLRQKGWTVNHKRVASLLRRDGLQALRPQSVRQRAQRLAH